MQILSFLDKIEVEGKKSSLWEQGVYQWILLKYNKNYTGQVMFTYAKTRTIKLE